MFSDPELKQCRGHLPWFDPLLAQEWLEMLTSNKRLFHSATLSQEQEDVSSIQHGLDGQTVSNAAKQLEAWLIFKHIVCLEEQLPNDKLLNLNQLIKLWVQTSVGGFSNQDGFFTSLSIETAHLTLWLTGWRHSTSLRCPMLGCRSKDCVPTRKLSHSKDLSDHWLRSRWRR